LYRLDEERVQVLVAAFGLLLALVKELGKLRILCLELLQRLHRRWIVVDVRRVELQEVGLLPPRPPPKSLDPSAHFVYDSDRAEGVYLVEDDVSDAVLGKDLPVLDPLLQARVQPLVVHVQQLHI
jgi:hypothetical protein